MKEKHVAVAILQGPCAIGLQERDTDTQRNKLRQEGLKDWFIVLITQRARVLEWRSAFRYGPFQF